MNFIRKIGLSLILFVLFAGQFIPSLGETVHATTETKEVGNRGIVYIIPVEQNIERGLEKFMERGFEEAKSMDASLIVLEINTPGGRIDTAEEIGALIRQSEIETVAYIHGNAASAGSYIALNADQIMMAPGSMIGAASLINGSTGEYITDPKLISYWKSKLAGAAELNGRNSKIAEGMADLDMIVEMPEINYTKSQGDIISLTSDQALKVGYSEQTAKTVEEAITFAGYSTEDVFRVEHTFSEKLAEFLTSRVVMTLLLFMGIAGVIIELLVPGFGVPGILGIAGFSLYFFGNSVAGFAGSETWILFLIGIVMLVIELFIPSFGILGLIGSISLIVGVVRAAYSASHVALSLGIAIVSAIIVIIIVANVFKKRGIWNRFILKDTLSKEMGYIPTASKDSLLGKEGISVTPLRPSGTALIDGERVDVVADGEFIDTNSIIHVVKVEGSRIVVESIVK
ncbi:NfeD family protein [Paenibacillus crassostreae]|uniref:Serine protease n=1 Tax=Paenibacillus crassostreae TaxID=1763538 RepID=A0A167C2G8_9BACL|nr:NfeD family protein [Paenibacillus crassostreae]AOZ91727.1 serine protease [Paenibacillus crassostreae]OAB72700.1 serine protease [Paenibacillus crassostreae]